MKCEKSECKEIMKYNFLSFESLVSQLEMCENCRYNQSPDKIGDETYKKIRLEYVKRFWENRFYNLKG